MVRDTEMIYTDSNRGVIQNRARARQIIDFSGIRYGNITPTDIDGFFERGNMAFVFYEMKYGDADMPNGQRIALERLVDAMRAANKKAVLFLCRHDVDDVNADVDAENTTVDKIYFNGEWHDGEKKTLKQYSDAFMRWAVPEFLH